MKKSIFLSLILVFSLISCSEDNPETPVIPEDKIKSLKEAPYTIGAAVSVPYLKSDEQYRQLLVKEVNSVTAENAMKMVSLSTAKGRYRWDDADYLVDFALENNMRVHGHTLIWYSSNAWWIENSFSGTKEEWKAVMKEYIQDVVTHFKGKVVSWDVVNEAFNDDGTYRPSIWYDNIGEEYIELAFRYAHEADPDAVLFYNDYGQEYDFVKIQAINAMADDLLERGVPIHGIGLQMHTNVNMSETNIRYAIKSVQNLKIHISEFDVSVNPENDPEAVFTEELAERQKTIYKYASKAMMDVSDDLCYGITFWGITDKYSWRKSIPDWMLPFDENYQKKPAYEGMMEAFNGR